MTTPQARATLAPWVKAARAASIQAGSFIAPTIED
jgi:hypothetical protein